MSALPRPAVTGPVRTLNGALHDLHHRAGWPSLRALAREAGVSHTTVSKVFSTAALPAWGTLELLVEAMDGDTEQFHDLWLAASTASDGGRPRPPRIAGRRAELDAVRRHLETGTGLLLVTGEAGIGKTTLAGAATRSSAVVVATAHCRPLSTPVPLMPVADLLRDVGVVREASWSAAVLRSCPTWVRSAVAPLLPEIEVESSAAGPDDFARQRLMTALVVLLDALGADRRVALWVDDLPWADPGTLDLLELLASRGAAVPVVGTWRTDDPDTSREHLEWWARVGARSARIHLDPLSRDETAEQLGLMDGSAPSSTRVAEIYARSLGQPLFTEHLAQTSGSGDTVPGALAAVLSRRLQDLGPDGWVLTRTLGVADRPLTVAQLARATDGDVDLTSVLRTLVTQRIVRGSGDEVQLRHPLLAESVREMLVPGEAANVHVRVAEVLTELPDPPAAEIAAHWQAAHRSAEELVWRVRAARAAEARFAAREAFPEWARAWELWPPTTPPPEGTVDAALADVAVRTIESAIGAGEGVDAVRLIIDDAMAAELPELGRAEVLLRSGDLQAGFGDLELGLRQLDESIGIHLRHPPSREAAHALETRFNIMSALGRQDQVREDVDRGLAIARALGARDVEAMFQAQSAWLRLVDGDTEEALRLAQRAVQQSDLAWDPTGTVRVAAYAAEVLLAAGAGATAIAAAMAPALEQAERWHIRRFFIDVVVSIVSEAFLREGDVNAAARAVEPFLRDVHGAVLRRSQRAQSAVDLRRGDATSAQARLERIREIDNYGVGAADCDYAYADVLLWTGRPHDAAAVIDRATRFLRSGTLALETATFLVMRARSAADLADADHVAGPGRIQLREEAEALRWASAADPFGRQAFGADLPANTMTWHCELDRTTQRDSAESWARAASAWDALHRPHAAAYSRWRAAQCALRDGRGTIATRLLKRAAVDAREHVPLSRAIAGTAAR